MTLRWWAFCSMLIEITGKMSMFSTKIPEWQITIWITSFPIHVPWSYPSGCIPHMTCKARKTNTSICRMSIGLYWIQTHTLRRLTTHSTQHAFSFQPKMGLTNQRDPYNWLHVYNEIAKINWSILLFFTPFQLSVHATVVSKWRLRFTAYFW
jgi:hypothetical protein